MATPPKASRFSNADKLISVCFLLGIFHIALGIALGLLVSPWLMGILIIVGIFLMAMALATALFRLQQSIPKVKVNDDLPPQTAQLTNENPSLWALLFCLFLENY